MTMTEVETEYLRAINAYEDATRVLIHAKKVAMSDARRAKKSAAAWSEAKAPAMLAGGVLQAASRRLQAEKDAKHEELQAAKGAFSPEQKFH